MTLTRCTSWPLHWQMTGAVMNTSGEPTTELTQAASLLRRAFALDPERALAWRRLALVELGRALAALTRGSSRDLIVDSP